jgi:hypothetical protein
MKKTKKYYLTIECASEDILKDLKVFLLNDGDQQILCYDEDGDKCFYSEFTEVTENTVSMTCDYEHEYE